MIKECLIHEVQHHIQAYIRTLSSPFDSFLEEHIRSSTFYMVLDEQEEVGYYAIHNNRLLTQFFIRPSYQKHAQELFDRVIADHEVKALFVPTCDELFISLALDKDFTITKQAYFFQDSRVHIPEDDACKEDRFSPAGLEDLLHIQQICGDFLDQYERRIENGELFTYYRGSVLLGIGVFEKSSMLEGVASIGMFTNEVHRRQGIGRNIILKLKTWCYDHALTPISGCWYYNESSKRTLESAGMVTRTRLLNIKVN
ncbi:GNAT family N-acetyltransferase [Paenibacillus sedimenti]|uniref:GNAT family N-acetyltransferase n=1 Tax=Paenibacillus sedimenti TaxID=2770274 RepID=A0A926KQI2_9BACL|nr:GNAT family N-acetyltransferase [Paenibacillus sedimenti]MBD0382204.1 GNAT family N-acetyltransferase [Paenibacillus sedimenti]